MKQIGSQFVTDEEYKQLILGKAKLTWKEFLLWAAKERIKQKGE